MAKRKKTSKVGLDAINHYNKQLRWVQECIDAKATLPIEEQTNYLKEKSIEYFVGFINGVVGTVGAILAADNCYYGFNYIDENNNIIYPTSTCAIANHPDYVSWRVQFIIRD